MAFKKILLFSSVLSLCSVPILSSPLVMKNKIISLNLHEIANFEYPKTEFGWKNLYDDSLNKSSEIFSKIQTYAEKREIELTNQGLKSGDVNKIVIDEVKRSDNFQWYIAYVLRKNLASANMLKYDENSIEYAIQEADIENISSFKMRNKTPFDGAYIIWDIKNDIPLPLNDISLNSEMEFLINDTYNEIFKINSEEIMKSNINNWQYLVNENFVKKYFNYENENDVLKKEKIKKELITEYNTNSINYEITFNNFQKLLNSNFTKLNNKDDEIEYIEKIKGIVFENSKTNSSFDFELFFIQKIRLTIMEKIMLQIGYISAYEILDDEWTAIVNDYIKQGEYIDLTNVVIKDLINENFKFSVGKVKNDQLNSFLKKEIFENWNRVQEW